MAEGRENVEHFNGLDFSIEIEKDDEYVDDDDTDNQTIYVKAFANERELGHVLFTIDYDGQGMILKPQDLEVDERYRGQGIAQTMYDFVKSKGYKIRRSGQQTDAGRGFWDKHRPEQNVWEDAESSDRVIFIGNDTAIVGQEHGKRLQLSDSAAERVQDIAQRHGAWYEGNGMDQKLTKGIIDDYEGSWDDDLLSPAIKGYPAPFLYVLFSNIKENDTIEGKIGFDPDSTIFDRILDTQPSTNYFVDRKFDADTLQKFFKSVSEGPYDFLELSQLPATEKNVRKFFTLGEKLMFPKNWEEYPYRAGRVAKSVNDLRDKFLATRKKGVYVAGSDHLKAVQQFLDQPNNSVVTELYEPENSFPLNWYPSDDPKEASARAYDRNRGYIDIKFTPVSDDAVEVEFSRNDSYDMTGGGDASRVLGTVLNAFREYLKGYQPKILIFSSKGASRSKVYQNLINRFASTVGYKQFDTKKLSPETQERLAFSGGDVMVLRKMYNPQVTEDSDSDIKLSHSMSPDMLYVNASHNGSDAGGARFRNIDGVWTGDIVHVYPQFRRQGIATKMYNYAEDLVGKIIPSKTLKPKGKKFWANRVKQDVTEAPLADYQTMGDFDKPGPFRGVDKKLVPHPTNQLKTAKFFEQTPYDFRLFFSNIPGTGKYSEHGPMDANSIRAIFKDQAENIIQNSENAITVVFVGNKGDSKVMLTPWMMAHRIGHAVQSGSIVGRNAGPWKAAEQHLFNTMNGILNEYYGKPNNNRYDTSIDWSRSAEYSALFNYIGTQRSSRQGEIRRPYEFLYELFAQYLGTGRIQLNPLPVSLGYGRQAWGKQTRGLYLKPDYRDDASRTDATDILAGDMQYMFDDVLSSLVGKILVM